MSVSHISVSWKSLKAVLGRREAKKLVFTNDEGKKCSTAVLSLFQKPVLKLHRFDAGRKRGPRRYPRRKVKKVNGRAQRKKQFDIDHA